MLSNIETSNAKLLQIALVGQPELGRVLSLAEMRQFRQRIGISCHIQPLQRQETEEYILHRLSVAGNRDALSFAGDSLDKIHEFSGGIPRQINTLCNFLLLTAFTEERRDISEEMVREVADGIGLLAHQGSETRSAPTTRPIMHASSNGDSAGKLALLKALRCDLPENTSTAAEVHGAGHTDGTGEYPLAIRAIGSRLQAMEQEVAILRNDGYADLRQRLDSLEVLMKRALGVRGKTLKDDIRLPVERSGEGSTGQPTIQHAAAGPDGARRDNVRTGL